MTSHIDRNHDIYWLCHFKSPSQRFNAAQPVHIMIMVHIWRNDTWIRVHDKVPARPDNVNQTITVTKLWRTSVSTEITSCFMTADRTRYSAWTCISPFSTPLTSSNIIVDYMLLESIDSVVNNAAMSLPVWQNSVTIWNSLFICCSVCNDVCMPKVSNLVQHMLNWSVHAVGIGPNAWWMATFMSASITTTPMSVHELSVSNLRVASLRR